MYKNTVCFYTCIFMMFFCEQYYSEADGMLISWSPQTIPGMTEQRFNAAKMWPVDSVINKNLAVNDWGDIYLLMVASSQKKDLIIDRLIEQINNNSITNLKNTNRLIIWERIKSGELIFEGKGYQTEDDLFMVGGRANWILRTITGKNFGYVKTEITIDELKTLQSKWSEWRRGQEIEEYDTPYKSDSSIIEEITSIEAIDAMIFSLKDNPVKVELTRNCLKNIYSMDSLPKDPSSPANLCNPDSYTKRYLAILTGITDLHNFEWWSNWWLENKERIVWNKQKSIFEVIK